VTHVVGVNDVKSANLAPADQQVGSAPRLGGREQRAARAEIQILLVQLTRALGSKVIRHLQRMGQLEGGVAVAILRP
jgi:hypothetical protein